MDNKNEIDDHEIVHIGNMIDAATKHGLLAEVIWSFGISCRNNKPLEVSEYAQCCEEAMNSWDI